MRKIFRKISIDRYYYNGYLEQLKEEEKDTSPVGFFKGCPHFFDNTCSSNNWGCDSPCHKCFKEGKYNPQNAEKRNKEVGLFVNIKDEKCR